MFSSSSQGTSRHQTLIPTLRQVLVPKLESLQKEEIGIPEKAAKKIGIDRESTVKRMNTSFEVKYKETKELIEKNYKQAVIFDEIREFVASIFQDLHLLKGELWDQRIAHTSCAQNLQMAEAYAEITCIEHVPFQSFSLEIKALASEKTGGEIKPIPVLSMSDPLNWPEGHLIINQEKILLLPTMSLTDIMVAINQQGQGKFQMTYRIIDPISEREAGRLKLIFHSLNPQEPLVFGDDTQGHTLAALGFSEDQGQGEEAILCIDGDEIRRPTNVITNVLPGVTLKLNQVTPLGVRNFLRVSIKPPEDMILETLERLIGTLKQFHAYVEMHAPSDPQADGILKGFYFLRTLDQELQKVFLGIRSSSHKEMPFLIPAQFGLNVNDQNQSIVFNPQIFKKELTVPENCRLFFSGNQSIAMSDVSIMTLPQSYQGNIQLRLVEDAGEIRFFLRSVTDRVDVEGSVQGATAKGPEGHPLEAMTLMMGASAMRKLKDGSQTPIEGTLSVTSGFADELLAKIDRAQRDFDQKIQDLQTQTGRAMGEISSLNGKLSEKREELQKKSARFQQTYHTVNMQSKFVSKMMEEMYKKD